jgi:hypothetical protein
MSQIDFPSARDVAIFYEVRILCRRQMDVSRQFGLSQARVSQIVSEVSQWRASVSPAEGGDLPDEDRRRADRRVARQRIEAILEWAMADYEASRRPHVTTKFGVRGGKPFHKTTVKEQRPSAQHLKLAVKLSEELHDWDAPAPRAPELTDPILWAKRFSEVLLAKVERGEKTVDQADMYALVFGGAKEVTVERTWAKYELDPVRDRETPVAYIALVSELPREYTDHYGRFYRTRDQGEVCVPHLIARAASPAAQKCEKIAQIMSDQVVPPGPGRDSSAGERQLVCDPVAE